jgi:hypothetical protein
MILLSLDLRGAGGSRAATFLDIAAQGVLPAQVQAECRAGCVGMDTDQVTQLIDDKQPASAGQRARWYGDPAGQRVGHVTRIGELADQVLLINPCGEGPGAATVRDRYWRSPR